MIRLIRMRSGEDVIGEVSKENTEYVEVENPAVLMPMRDGRGNEPVMGMVPWQPFSKNTTFSISRDWTVTISDPSEDIEDNYRRVYGSGIEVPTKKLLYS